MTFWGGLLGKDNLSELDDVIVNLEFLAEAEEQISALYRLFAGKMPKELDLWNSLADAEMQHVENIGRLIDLIHNNPHHYKPGVSFNTVAIRMFIVEMQSLQEQVSNGHLSCGDFFEVALKIENSAIEIGYGKIARTKEARFNAIACLIDQESADHRSTISARMSATLA